MKETVLSFGLISRAPCSLQMGATVPLADNIGFDRAEFVGYSISVLSFLLVFFGIRSYRENVATDRPHLGRRLRLEFRSS